MRCQGSVLLAIALTTRWRNSRPPFSQTAQSACVAHTTGLLDWRRANQALFIMPPWHYPESIRARVIALRDEYEKIFIGLIDDLPLRKGGATLLPR